MMDLGELIEYLESIPGDFVFVEGFHNPHSYRGRYEMLAFEPKLYARCSDMRACALAALDADFQGYKGGTFTMHEGKLNKRIDELEKQLNALKRGRSNGR